MNVLVTATSFPKDDNDWRGVFIREIVNSLASLPDVNVRLCAAHGDVSSNVEYCCSKDEGRFFDWLLAQGGIAHLLRSDGWRRVPIVLSLIRHLRRIYTRHNVDSDIFHVNWLQNVIPAIGIKKPLLITALGSDMHLLKFPGMVFLIRKALKNRNAVIAPNAQWMTEVLEKYFGDVAHIQHVPFGIDDELYQITDVPKTNVKKWIVISRITKNKLGPLLQLGKDIFNGEHELHLIGPMQEDISLPEWVHYHGATNPGEIKCRWLPSAFGLITLSSHSEGRPQIMLEAMAAGVPIIASKIAAHSDFITHKETGLLVSSESELSDAMRWLNENTNHQDITYNAREWVRRENGTWRDCAIRYRKLYEMLLTR